MFERYSEESRQALFLARGTAISMRANSIEPHHLLAGALEMWPPAESCRRVVLQSFDVTVPAELNVPGDIPFSAAVKRLLNTAVVRADRFGQHRIRPQHLLIALLEEPGLDALFRQAGIGRDILIASATQDALVDDSPFTS